MASCLVRSCLSRETDKLRMAFYSCICYPLQDTRYVVRGPLCIVSKGIYSDLWFCVTDSSHYVYLNTPTGNTEWWLNLWVHNWIPRFSRLFSIPIPKGNRPSSLMEHPILEKITVKPSNVTKCKKNENKLFIIIIIRSIVLTVHLINSFTLKSPVCH